MSRVCNKPQEKNASKQRDVHSLSHFPRLLPRARTFVLFKQFYNRVIGRRDSNFPIVLVPGVSNFNVGALAVCMDQEKSPWEICSVQKKIVFTIESQLQLERSVSDEIFFAPFDFLLKRSKHDQISDTFFVVYRFSLHAPKVLTPKSGTPCICTYTWRETTSATIRISFPRRASLFLEFDYTIHSCKLTVR